ncbi:MAG TPA: hypothetical protein PLE99_05160 [Candidatus Thiothrix moscowensis]|uniref:hypothetical protein n=1 Tax=unclassified Thiothrix TaxID=2636184 RepID=UPI0025D987C3|nr:MULTISPECIES: hypothetical protein [unclassified Thiothrix]HRJ52134.1 hypothetical protein [Candidatus Thiothrix moscowensis]HRJ92355.1 hypothetical protein [Candidatus Thiothrix moscowensis]
MVWRLIAVIWVLALLVGVAFHFSDEIFALTQHVLALDPAGMERILKIEEMLAKGLGILGVILTFFAAVWHFVEGKQSDKAQAGNVTTTTFRKDVLVGGDLTLGNKTVNGGKDAGQG